MVTSAAAVSLNRAPVPIDPEAVKEGDVEMLQDMIMAAANEALRTAQDMVQKRLGGLTQGLNIPGLPF